MKRAILFFAIALAAGSAFGQNTGPGTPPFGSFTPGSLDVVNNQNLNVHLVVPFEFVKGRGMNFPFSEINDSQVWVPTTSGSTKSWTPAISGWQTLNPNGSLSYAQAIVGSCTFGDPGYSFTFFIYYYNNFVFTDGQGTSHLFPSVSFTIDESCGTTGNSGTTAGYASDNSGYYVNSFVVTNPGGMKYSTGSQAVMDANGNYISQTTQSSGTTSWVNSAGVTAVTQTTSSNYSISYADVNGTTTVNLEKLIIKTNFGCPGVVEYTGMATVPSSIT